MHESAIPNTIEEAARKARLSKPEVVIPFATHMQPIFKKPAMISGPFRSDSASVT